MQYLESLVIPVYTQLKQGQKKPTIEGNNQEQKKVRVKRLVNKGKANLSDEEQQ